jgi:hypothetical protein
VFTEGYQFYAPEEIDNEYTLGDGKVMINVGSVGQPRDGDPRACYVILEDGQDGSGSPSPLATEAPTTVEFAALSDMDDYDDPDTEERVASPSPAKPSPCGPVRVTFRRLPYDFETTIQKIYSISELEPFLGDRLRQGR